MHKTPFRFRKTYCSEVLSVRLGPTFFRHGQALLFMLGKHLFYLENKEKLHPFSSSAKEHSCLSLNCSPAYYQ